MEESLQEWLCDNWLEVTECISIVLRKHEQTYGEWFKYVDDGYSPDMLAIYCLSRKIGVHTAIFNNFVGLILFLGPTKYGVLCKIRKPDPNANSTPKQNITSGGSRISRGGANSPGGAPTYDFAKCSRKLHEIERIWVPRVVHPRAPLNLPLITTKSRRRKTTCRDRVLGRSSNTKRGCGRGRGSRTAEPSETLSEPRSRNYGITPPAMNTRTLRSNVQPIDYLCLNNGLEEDTPLRPKWQKRSTHRPRNASSASRVAAQKHITSPRA